MPRISQSVTNPTTASSVTTTVSFAAADANDVICVIAMNRGSTTVSMTVGTGWDRVLITAASGSWRGAMFVKRTAGGTESTVTLSGANAPWNTGYVVLKGVPASTTLSGLTAATAYGTAVSSFAGPTLSSLSDKDLVLMVANNSQLGANITSNDVVLQGGTTDWSGNWWGTHVMKAAGAFSTTFYMNTNGSPNGHVLAVVFPNDTGETCEPDYSANYGPHVQAFELYDSGVFTASAPNTLTGDGAGNINSIALYGTASTLSISTSAVIDPNYYVASIATTDDGTAGGASGRWNGVVFSKVSGSLDLDGRTLVFPVRIGGTIRILTEGIIYVFEDASGNWEAHQIRPLAGIAGNSTYIKQIKAGTTTPYAFSGSLNWGAVTKIAHLVHRSNTTSAMTLYHYSIFLVDGLSVVGGGVDRPLKAADVHAILDRKTSVIGASAFQGRGQIIPQASMQFGDGTVPTYVEWSPASFEFPATTNSSWDLPASSATATIKPSADDTMDFSAGLLVTDSRQALTIGASGSASAAVSLTGSSIVGPWDFTDDVGYDLASATLKNSSSVTLAGGDYSLLSIISNDNNTAATACTITANGSLANSSTDVSAATTIDYHLTLGASVTAYALTNHTFTGSALTNKVHVLKTSATVTAGAFVTGESYEIKTVGTTDFTLIGASANTIGVRFTATGAGSGTGDAYEAVKITIEGTTSLVETDVDTAGAVVWVAAPALNQVVAITGLAATYRLQIFDIEYDLTVSGITVTPTAGATYTHNGITWTVRSASITAGAGTITVYGTGTPAASGTLTKTAGTGDASVVFSAYAVGGTELYIGVPAATSYTWTDSVAAAAPRVIRVRVMEDGPGTGDAIEMIDAIVGMCGITDGTEAVGYLVAAVADDVYNDRGVDGSAITGITIDDSTLRLEIASGTITNYNGTDVLVVDGRDLYAYETYWLGTTAGMRDEARFIEAIDAVNFRCSNFKLKGTSGYPIMINNCFIVDAATGIFSSMVDYSGDPISNHPEHMKAIVVTTSDSVVTGTLAEFIAAVPTANDIAQEVVTGITF